MPAIAVRIRTPARMLRIDTEDTKTIGDLRLEVAKELAVPLAKIALTVLPPAGGKPLSDTASLRSLRFENGQMLLCSLPAGTALSAPLAAPSASVAAPARTVGKDGSLSVVAAPSGASAASAAAPPRTLTARCNHGPNGACQFCCPPSEADYAAKKEEVLNAAGRYAPRHAERSSATVHGEAADMEWLCHHRADAMCTNCAPLHVGDKVPLAMLCQHGPDARCTNCLPPDTTIEGRKFLTFREYLERRRAKCEHSFSATCLNCAPPSETSYASRAATCPRHAPWPRGICLECTAPPVDCALQPYRHVDYIQVHNLVEMQGFLHLWDANKAVGLQRAGILVGRYLPDSNFRFGTKAVVEAIYEPPQSCDAAAGTVKLLPDPSARAFGAVCGALGLVPIGWFVTRRQRLAADPIVPPNLLIAMAEQQLHHPRSDGLPGSQFVTLLASRDPATGQIAPQGFMASDTLMALVRDKVLAAPAHTDAMIRIRTAAPGEPPMPEVIRKEKLRGRYKSTEFEPEFATVSLEAGHGHESAAKEAADGGPFFKHATFPVENRSMFGVVQSAGSMREHLARYKAEPHHVRLSDFHALMFLATHLDAETGAAIAAAVGKGQPLEEGILLLLSSFE